MGKPDNKARYFEYVDYIKLFKNHDIAELTSSFHHLEKSGYLDIEYGSNAVSDMTLTPLAISSLGY